MAIQLSPELLDALWAADVDALYDLAPCRCCCHEHTFTTGCPAYAWGGCRGQSATTPEEVESWVVHYTRHHGMTREEFFA